MRIYVPYSKLLDATRISLRGYDYETVLVKGKYGYSKFLKERWEKGESFINVEHDSVLWPGAIESLENCIGTWCVYDYSQTNWSTQEAQLNSVPMGCMKITQQLMAKTWGVWDKPVDWRECDVHLFRAAREAGLEPHQHFPSIVNANKVLLG